MKAISSGSLNVGKATIAAGAWQGYTPTSPNWHVSAEERLKRKEKKAAEEGGAALKKKLDIDIDVVINPIIGLIVGLAEIFHKLMALLLIETEVYDKGKRQGVEWFLFEYLAAWIFFRLDVPKLLAMLEVKNNPSAPLFEPRARVTITTNSASDFKAGVFSMGNVHLEIELNIKKNLHVGLDTSIYKEEYNLFSESTRLAFFEAMANLQKQHKLLAVNYPKELKK